MLFNYAAPSRRGPKRRQAAALQITRESGTGFIYERESL
jgi:hypothetical protein